MLTDVEESAKIPSVCIRKIAGRIGKHSNKILGIGGYVMSWGGCRRLRGRKGWDDEDCENENGDFLWWSSGWGAGLEKKGTACVC